MPQAGPPVIDIVPQWAIDLSFCFLFLFLLSAFCLCLSPFASAVLGARERTMQTRRCRIVLPPFLVRT